MELAILAMKTMFASSFHSLAKKTFLRADSRFNIIGTSPVLFFLKGYVIAY